MFGDNWYVFLLIVMLVFAGDGAMNTTEIAVMLAILFALSLTGGCTSDDSTNQNCFCNRGASTT